MGMAVFLGLVSIASVLLTSCAATVHELSRFGHLDLLEMCAPHDITLSTMALARTEKSRRPFSVTFGEPIVAATGAKVIFGPFSLHLHLQLLKSSGVIQPI